MLSSSKSISFWLETESITITPPLSEGDIIILWLEDRDFKTAIYLLGKVRLSVWQLVEAAIILFTNPSARAGYDTRSIF